MALDFDGEFEVEKSPDDVYDFLTDPERFAPLLPDFEDLELHENGSFTIKVKVGVSHISGTAKVELDLVEDDPPNHALYRGSGSVVGGSVDLEAGFDLEEVNSGNTLVKWRGKPDVSGKIVSMAGGLLEPIAKKNIEKTIGRLRDEMES